MTNRAKIEAATDQSRYEFLQTDLALCFTFLDLLKTEFEIGHDENAERILRKAETGFETIQRFLPYVQDPGHRDEIEEKLADLRIGLDSIKGRGKNAPEAP